MRKLPDNENMYTFSEASEMIGKSRSYISLFLRRYKGDIPENAIIETNWSKYITDSGLAWLNQERAKKGRDSHPRDKKKTAKSTEDVNKRIQDEMKRIASDNEIKSTIQRSQSSEQSL